VTASALLHSRGRLFVGEEGVAAGVVAELGSDDFHVCRVG
jgi:hypothetical protein